MDMYVFDYRIKQEECFERNNKRGHNKEGQGKINGIKM